MAQEELSEEELSEEELHDAIARLLVMAGRRAVRIRPLTNRSFFGSVETGLETPFADTAKGADAHELGVLIGIVARLNSPAAHRRAISLQREHVARCVATSRRQYKNLLRAARKGASSGRLERIVTESWIREDFDESRASPSTLWHRFRPAMGMLMWAAAKAANISLCKKRFERALHGEPIEAAFFNSDHHLVRAILLGAATKPDACPPAELVVAAKRIGDPRLRFSSGSYIREFNEKLIAVDVVKIAWV